MPDQPAQPPPGLKSGATVIYVDDVPAALAFYGRFFSTRGAVTENSTRSPAAP
jgi:hypothetical protein